MIPGKKSKQILWMFLCLLPGLLQVQAKAEIPSYDMVRIKAGTFLMGSPQNETLGRDDEQLHRVVLTRDFFMGRYEVTQAFYQEIMGSNPSYNHVCPTCPVEMISWRDAVLFCNVVSRKAGLRAAYQIHGARITLDLDAPGYRLPTEAEWEYACRAGTRTIFPHGNCITTDEANINGYRPQPGCSSGLNRAETIPVGSFAPNGWGLYDMVGNINEFCWDWYAFFTAKDEVDPLGGPPGEHRVFRGGAFNNYPANCHSASRQKREPDTALDMVGLRMVRTAEAAKKAAP